MFVVIGNFGITIQRTSGRDFFDRIGRKSRKRTISTNKNNSKRKRIFLHDLIESKRDSHNAPVFLGPIFRTVSLELSGFDRKHTVCLY